MLEGGEAVGKSTQARALADRLSAHGVRSEIVREPGGDPFAEAGRDLLLGDIPRSPEAEAIGFNSVRAQLLVAVVIPLLESGTWVIGDRGSLSTVVYQGHAGGANLEWVRRVCDNTVALCPPDLELVLDLPDEQAASRRKARGDSDRFEQMDESFHSRVYSAYRHEAAEAGLALVDASAAPEHVTDQIWSLLWSDTAPLA